MVLFWAKASIFLMDLWIFLYPFQFDIPPQPSSNPLDSIQLVLSRKSAVALTSWLSVVISTKAQSH